MSVLTSHSPRQRGYPLFQLFAARLREFYREPEVIFWVYGFPMILAIGLGIAFWNRKPEPAQVDIQESPDAAELQKQLQHPTLFQEPQMHVEIRSADDCRQRFRTGKTDLIVISTLPGYKFFNDPTRPESRSARYQVEAAIWRWKGKFHVPKQANLVVQCIEARAVGLVGVPVGALTQATVAVAIAHSDAFTPITEQPTDEPGNRYIDFLLPGLMGLNLLGGGMWGVGFVIVDMRVRKLLKRLLATPMRRSDFLLSVLSARLALLLPEMILLLLVGWLAFGVPVRGDPLVLALTVILGAAAFAGIGLLLACRTEKTETISGLINLVMLPMWLLSGTFFSSKRFPDAAQPYIQALPLTQVNDVLREVMLEGASLGQVTWRLAILAAWAVISFSLALKWFRWQ